MKTTLCHLLGIEHPIIAAPMGPDLTGPDLVAAVSNAGGLGILQAHRLATVGKRPSWGMAPRVFRRREYHRTQALPQ
jgi:NAD(P)H-dependent flavin oxidoreductase YrpB (nitropropane dioxygenase family)